MTTDAEAPKRLYRSRTDKKIAGVLGGVAEYLGMDPSLVRIAYAVGTVLTGFVPLMALYVLMIFIVPATPKARSA
jgi:phage shock protein PspC (stress-responsive transcriptional regulator)